jgi:hypothetical protein
LVRQFEFFLEEKVSRTEPKNTRIDEFFTVFVTFYYL